MPDSEGHFSKRCAGFTAPITLRSRSFPTSSTGKLATTTEMSVPIARAVFRLYRRPRKRTARVESISPSTGPLIRQKESPLVAVWPIMCSITPSRRFTRGRSRTRNLKSKIANRQCNGGEGGIRTLGSLLGYGALAKRCFQPLSHLTKNRLREYGEELLIANLRLLIEMVNDDQRGRCAQ